MKEMQGTRYWVLGAWFWVVGTTYLIRSSRFEVLGNVL